LGIDPPFYVPKTLIWGGYGRGEGVITQRPPGEPPVKRKEGVLYDKMTIPNKVIPGIMFVSLLL